MKSGTKRRFVAALTHLSFVSSISTIACVALKVETNVVCTTFFLDLANPLFEGLELPGQVVFPIVVEL